jgi:hypothetical protein
MRKVTKVIILVLFLHVFGKMCVLTSSGEFQKRMREEKMKMSWTTAMTMNVTWRIGSMRTMKVFAKPLTF